MKKILSIFLIGLLGGIAGALLVKEFESPLKINPSTQPSPRWGEGYKDEGEKEWMKAQQDAQAEEITLTTYYPSPYGVYESMVAVRLGVGDTSGPFGIPDGKYDNLDSPPSNQPGNVWIKGNMGIGTTSPFSRLSLGGAAADIAQRIAVYEASSGGNFYGIGIAHPDANYGVGIWANKTVTSTNMDMYIQSGGNVGIGTTKPGQKLTVDGVIESTSGGIKFPDGTTQVSGVPFGNVWVTNSTATFTVPPGVTRLWVEVYGGGGGGDSFGGGGGAGGVAMGFVNVTPGQVITATVGGGGSGGIAPPGGGIANGSPGGKSSFSGIEATGGGGGTGIGGIGGIGSGGLINQSGGAAPSSAGGSNTRAGGSKTTGGAVGSGFGGGGGAGGGGIGGAGGIIVWW